MTEVEFLSLVEPYANYREVPERQHELWHGLWNAIAHVPVNVLLLMLARHPRAFWAPLVADLITLKMVGEVSATELGR